MADGLVVVLIGPYGDELGRMDVEPETETIHIPYGPTHYEWDADYGEYRPRFGAHVLKRTGCEERDGKTVVTYSAVEETMAVKTIHESHFCNTYGGLNLVLRGDGRKYLEMEDCFGPEYFGPLTEEQIAAYYTLADAPQAKEKDNG